MPYIIFTLLVLEELTMSAVNFNMRLEEDLRDNANHIFEEYGLTMPQAFKLFLNLKFFFYQNLFILKPLNTFK